MKENVSGCFFLNTVYNVNSTSIVSGVGSRSFTTTRCISKTSVGGERVNVLLSLEFSSEANNPSAQSAPCRLASWGNCLTSHLVVTPLDPLTSIVSVSLFLAADLLARSFLSRWPDSLELVARWT